MHTQHAHGYLLRVARVHHNHLEQRLDSTEIDDVLLVVGVAASQHRQRVHRIALRVRVSRLSEGEQWSDAAHLGNNVLFHATTPRRERRERPRRIRRRL